MLTCTDTSLINTNLKPKITCREKFLIFEKCVRELTSNGKVDCTQHKLTFGLTLESVVHIYTPR